MLSIPNAIEALKDNDQQEWMNFIVEASGVSDAVEKAKEKKAAKAAESINNTRGIDGQPLYFTKKNVTELYGDIEAKKIDVFDELQGSLTPHQIDELNTTGYAIMNEQQLLLIYGEGSPYADTSALRRFGNASRKELAEKFERDVRLLAKMRNLNVNKTRTKRNIVGGASLLAPFVLAGGSISLKFIVLHPVVLSPSILSPTVLGPFILSPWVFVPVILSPRVMSPLILSPLVFDPVVLSPLALHPFILCPGVFNPFVLSPFALTPFILSPQFGTPLVLSPFVLSPLILNPMAVSPIVMSPFLLSPLILSPLIISNVILSPYIASPLVESELTNSEVILSPSFLS
ncbi:unnamed protein product [Toxocara canis]|uniref:PHM7_ext domain-containing protein n=1 Tax=Toxocara canis TaxID=6265 RepID=A0A183U3N4_TOXCA|nr:unnamed protein product [Toxocara canis]